MLLMATEYSRSCDGETGQIYASTTQVLGFFHAF
jgi:hypothetical protein